jgi:16S rRNA (guanine527-N7)-methyltransferase
VTSAALLEVLRGAQRIGLLGSGPVEAHVDHATSWAAVLEPQSFLDLGSGAGIPGLVLLESWPAVTGVLLDGQARRVAWLRAAIARLGLAARADVVEGRAEILGADPRHRERFGLVVARGFGPPAVTAECGAAFVRVGGTLSVSEPPHAESRWPEGPLDDLGLGIPRRVVHGGRSFVILPKTSSLAKAFPRRQTLQRQAPLW